MCGHDEDEHDAMLCDQCYEIQELEGAMHVPATPYHYFVPSQPEPTQGEQSVSDPTIEDVGLDRIIDQRWILHELVGLLPDVWGNAGAERARWDFIGRAFSNGSESEHRCRECNRPWANFGHEAGCGTGELIRLAHAWVNEAVKEAEKPTPDTSLVEGEAALREKQWSLHVNYWGGREWAAQWGRPDAIVVKRATAETEHEARVLALDYAIRGIQ